MEQVSQWVELVAEQVLEWVELLVEQVLEWVGLVVEQVLEWVGLVVDHWCLEQVLLLFVPGQQLPGVGSQWHHDLWLQARLGLRTGPPLWRRPPLVCMTSGIVGCHTACVSSTTLHYSCSTA